MISTDSTKIGKMTQSRGQQTNAGEALEIVRQYINGEIEEKEIPEDVKALAKAAYAQKEAMKVLFLNQHYVKAQQDAFNAYTRKLVQWENANKFASQLKSLKFSYTQLKGAERAIYQKLNQTLNDTRDIFARWYRGNESYRGYPQDLMMRVSAEETVWTELNSVVSWAREKGVMSTGINQPIDFTGDAAKWFRESLSEVLNTGIKAGVMPTSLKRNLRIVTNMVNVDMDILDTYIDVNRAEFRQSTVQLNFGRACYAFCVLGEVLKDIGNVIC